ncbi:MAG TPA: PAS domain-containing sensor histidine kinase [Cyclobacteriaceae bacterium]
MKNEEDKYQFEALFNHATIGMVITDSQGRVIKFNHCAEDQFGYIEEELIGKPIEILIPEKLKGDHISYRTNFHKSPTNRAMGSGRDLLARRKNGDVFPVEISLSHFARDAKTYVIAFVIDISIRKMQEKEIKESSHKIQKINTELEMKVDGRTKMLRETLAELEVSKEELNESLKKERELGDLKSRFVTMASHEFRTPLSTILSSASLVGKYTEGEDQPKRKKHIDRIKEAVGNMRDILEDFLSLGKLEEGQVDVNMELLTKEEMRGELMKIVSSMDQLTKKEQSINLDCDLDRAVKLDKRLLGNLLSNLLSNAIKFSSERSVIEVKCCYRNDHLELAVKDNGIGISQQDQRHLFERFFRAKNASHIQGTGLGLNIVLKYVQLMKGKIRCQSEINEGTTFVIQIPQ